MQNWAKRKVLFHFLWKFFFLNVSKIKKLKKNDICSPELFWKSQFFFFMVEIEWKLISRIFFFSCVKLRKKVSSGRKSETKFKKKKKKNGLMCETELNLLNLYFFCMKLGEKKVFSREKNIFFLKNFLYDMWKIISKKQFFFSWRKQVKI